MKYLVWHQNTAKVTPSLSVACCLQTRHLSCWFQNSWMIFRWITLQNGCFKFSTEVKETIIFGWEVRSSLKYKINNDYVYRLLILENPSLVARCMEILPTLPNGIFCSPQDQASSPYQRYWTLCLKKSSSLQVLQSHISQQVTSAKSARIMSGILTGFSIK